MHSCGFVARVHIIVSELLFISKLSEHNSEKKGVEDMVNIDMYNFEEEVTQCDAEVFLVFSSARCSFCRDLKRLIQVLQRVLTDVKFCWVDTEKEPNLAAKFSVTHLPVSIVFEKGKEKARAVGALTKSDIYRLLDRTIKVTAK